ncbi:MAG: MFS transporter [Candidatus Hecatellaceae archaeon]
MEFRLARGRSLFSGAGVNVMLLGLTSLLTDFGSEMIMPILPLFIVSLGGAGIAVGLIAGIGDSLSSILKVFSGYWSDMVGRRKPFVTLGYVSSATAKLFFPLSTHWLHLVVLRPIERVGKGVRTAPRDALIAESIRTGFMGKGFGFHRAMDTAGAVLGSLSAFLLVWVWGLNIRTILLAAALISFTAIIPLLWVRETSPPKGKPQISSLKISLKGVPVKLKLFIFAATIFALAEFSCMFFILKVSVFLAGSGVEYVATPILFYTFFNVVYAVFAFPSGILADRFGRLTMVVIGYLLFAVTCLGFSMPGSLPVYAMLFVAYGLVYALVEGNVRAYVSELSPPGVKGTVLGAFHTSVGLAALPANILAGALWQLASPTVTFLYGAALSTLAAILAVKSAASKS